MLQVRRTAQADRLQRRGAFLCRRYADGGLERDARGLGLGGLLLRGRDDALRDDTGTACAGIWSETAARLCVAFLDGAAGAAAASAGAGAAGAAGFGVPPMVGLRIIGLRITGLSLIVDTPEEVAAAGAAGAAAPAGAAALNGATFGGMSPLSSGVIGVISGSSLIARLLSQLQTLNS